MQKKYIVASIALALAVWGMALSPVAAQTSTSSLPALIQQLQQQIAELKVKFEAALLSQRNVSEAAKNVGETLKLVKQLREGMSGDDVKTLQSLLAADPSIFPEGRITGFFGVLTREAVKRFQRRHNLEAVGMVGPRTLEKLQKLLEDHPLAVENDDDDDIDDDDRDTDERRHGRRPCAIVPPGQLIAPGWLRKHGGDRPIVPECQKLPPGIIDKLRQGFERGKASTTSDRLAPNISNPSVSSIASTSATIMWTTNEETKGRVYYGPTNNPPVLIQSHAGLSFSHTVMLSGLMASTAYNYLVESEDASGNKATSTQQSFLTTP